MLFYLKCVGAEFDYEVGVGVCWMWGGAIACGNWNQNWPYVWRIFGWMLILKVKVHMAEFSGHQFFGVNRFHFGEVSHCFCDTYGVGNVIF